MNRPLKIDKDPYEQKCHIRAQCVAVGGTPKANFGSQGVWWWGKQKAHFRSQGKGAGVRRGTKFAPALLEQPPIANA